MKTGQLPPPPRRAEKEPNSSTLKRAVVCLTQSGSKDRYWLEVQVETPEDLTGLVLATLNAPDGAPAAGSGMPICFPKKYWQQVTTKEVM